VEQPILDALYEASDRQKTYLGYVHMTDYTDMINTRSVTLWQPEPSTLAEARAWTEAQETPPNHLLSSRAVVSVIVNMETVKTVHDQEWSPVRD
jgi:hypothetical protein